MFGIKNNISLIGMAACGKSTTGVVLAKALGLSFIDTDLMLQQKHGRYLWEIIQAEGILKFIEYESAVIRSLTTVNSCIATGGSVVYSDSAMLYLQKISHVIYLDLPFDEIEQRLHDIKGRGVVIDEGKTLRDIYDERKLLYERYAHIVIAAAGKSVEDIVGEVVNRFS